MCVWMWSCLHAMSSKGKWGEEGHHYGSARKERRGDGVPACSCMTVGATLRTLRTASAMKDTWYATNTNVAGSPVQPGTGRTCASPPTRRSPALPRT